MRDYLREIIGSLYYEIQDPTSPTREMWGRLRNATLTMLVLLGIGTEGYYLIGKSQWPLFDCFYMTVIAISTVGFGELLPIAETALGRPFTVFLLLASMWINYYFISTITAFFLGREFQDLWWKRTMEYLSAQQKDHIVVCGGGETGIYVIKELLDSQRSIIVVDDNINRIKALQDQFGRFPAVVGDATEEAVLRKAGLDRAYGLVSLLSSDKDNLFITITARRMNPRLKIVSKAIELNAFDKLKSAGANRVVSPNYIGGVRIAAELIRPHVVQFLDLLTKDNELNLCIEEFTLPERSSYVGKQLSETDLRQKQLLVLAVYSPNRADWSYNPSPDYVFEPLSTLIVLGNIDAVQAFRQQLKAHR
ncbi:MAG: potassium channel protein [Myxococcales bacterium]|nr:potassium channel protein [Myxococcales bacterium]